MSGFDPKDSTVSDLPVPDYVQGLQEGMDSIKVAVLEKDKLEGVDPDVLQIYNQTLDLLEKKGAQITEMKFPSWEYSLWCYYLIAPSEASTNLARYDGVRYGTRHKDSQNLQSLYKKTRTEGFGQEVKRRILLGTFALSSGYYDAYYRQATRVRQMICQEFQNAFETVDFILTPTSPETAFRIGEKEDPLVMYLSDKFTVLANLTGLPALSIPVGLSTNGLPIGLQIIGNFFQEMRLFRLAFLIEKHVRFNKSK